ncbi:AgrD family cyclic lactone autoinducer peptide [Blautia sp.]
MSLFSLRAVFSANNTCSSIIYQPFSGQS